MNYKLKINFFSSDRTKIILKNTHAHRPRMDTPNRWWVAINTLSNDFYMRTHSHPFDTHTQRAHVLSCSREYERQRREENYVRITFSIETVRNRAYERIHIDERDDKWCVEASWHAVHTPFTGHTPKRVNQQYQYSIVSLFSVAKQVFSTPWMQTKYIIYIFFLSFAVKSKKWKNSSSTFFSVRNFVYVSWKVLLFFFSLVNKRIQFYCWCGHSMQCIWNSSKVFFFFSSPNCVRWKQ